MEQATIAFPDGTSPLEWQCTKRLCTAARRSSEVALQLALVDQVSPHQHKHTCKLLVPVFENPKALFCKFCFSERKLHRRALLRHKVKLFGLSRKGFNKLVHALNGNIYPLLILQDLHSGRTPSQYQMV